MEDKGATKIRAMQVHLFLQPEINVIKFSLATVSIFLLNHDKVVYISMYIWYFKMNRSIPLLWQLNCSFRPQHSIYLVYVRHNTSKEPMVNTNKNLAIIINLVTPCSQFPFLVSFSWHFLNLSCKLRIKAIPFVPSTKSQLSLVITVP